MLNGVGGCTIEQLKQNMTMQELKMWGAYRDLRGGLNFGRRIQQELAQIHYSFLVSKGVKNISIYDLMPNENNPNLEDDLMMAFMKWGNQ